MLKVVYAKRFRNFREFVPNVFQHMFAFWLVVISVTRMNYPNEKKKTTTPLSWKLSAVKC